MQRIFQFIDALIEHPQFILGQISRAETFHVSQRPEQLMLLVRMSQRCRVSWEQTLKRTNRASFTPAINQYVESLREVHKDALILVNIRRSGVY
jgi:hypothetical protein